MDLLNSLSSDNLIFICIVMGIIAIILAVVISIEIYRSNKKYKRFLEEENNMDDNLNLTYDSEVKYVDENSEIEKTKAKLELDSIREKLRKEEEEKRKRFEKSLQESINEETNKYKSKHIETDKNTENIETNINVEENKEKAENKIETNNVNVDINNIIKEKVNNAIQEAIENKKLEDVIKEDVKTVQETNINNKELSIKLDETLKKVEDSTKVELKEENNEVGLETADDEKEAIISYDELKNANHFGYTDDEMNMYVDEKDAIISIKELENMYQESQQMSTYSGPVVEEHVEEPKIEFEMKRVVDLPEFTNNNNFQNSPYISPVYGVRKTDDDLQLEQTANLEKLNEEIRKTNEFLKALKDLKKNLE